MKKNIVGVLAVAVTLVFALSGAVYAAPGDVTVDANVLTKCAAVGTGSFTQFDINPDDGVLAFNTSTDGTSPTVKCTKGTAVTVTCTPALAGTGVLTMAGDTPGGDITYTVSACPNIASASGFGGAGDAIDIGISLAAGAAASSAAGVHSGTITVTVTP